MSQLAFSIFQIPEEVGAIASEGMDLLARAKASRQRGNKLLPRPLYRLPAEVVAQIQGGSPHLKDRG